MSFQRHLFQAAKQYVSKYHRIQPQIRPSYSILHHRYSSSARRYTERHEWVSMDNEIGTVGISNYAQESLGDIVFAQLPDSGQVLIADEECGALESVKAASEIYSPVSGTVTERNKAVEDKPALINSSCYENGWLYKLRLSDIKEVDSLMTEAEYETYLKTDVEKEKETDS
ncbi:glycine cleavage system H protein, mitochondrial-like [Plodia interpunctella]|uniref:glycine cleavage system H protein, mitochondrial-like n=1 Tax=Plodia interpunctella TaxID=58824 RepID=UPI0023685D6F|nr:glycine cleavage system H protein, mitochondrial-like [Plodia interpunctella]